MLGAGSPVPQGTVETEFHPMSEAVRPLGVNALSCETLRWPRSLFPGKHGRVFTAGPAPANPPKRDEVVKVL